MKSVIEIDIESGKEIVHNEHKEKRGIYAYTHSIISPITQVHIEKELDVILDSIDKEDYRVTKILGKDVLNESVQYDRDNEYILFFNSKREENLSYSFIITKEKES